MFGGDPSKVLRARADLVLDALQYCDFQYDYQAAYVELNKENPS